MKARIVVSGALVLLLAGGAWIALLTGEAQADFGSEKVAALVDYIKGKHPDNRKLCAIEALRKKTDSGVEAELAKLAKSGDGVVAVACTTALGRKGGSTAKKELKSILESTKVATSVRIGALSAIAYGWKDSGDLDYLESKTGSDSDLSSHLTWLKKKVYGK